MSWQNPRPLEFNPNSAVMQGASAFSRLGDTFVQQAYQQERARQADRQFDTTHNLAINKFNYGKERDSVADKQWQDTFNQTGDNIRFNQGMKVADYTAGREDASNMNTYRNNTLGLHGRELALKQQALNDAKEGLGSFADWYTQSNPSLQNIQGLTPQGVSKIAEFEAKKTPTEYQTILGSIKQQELQSKQQGLATERLKQAPKVFESMPLYNNLSAEQQQEAMDYYVKTGQLPKINKQRIDGFYARLPFTDSHRYSFDLGDSNTTAQTSTQYDTKSDVEALKQMAEAAKALKGK
ncbi:MAG: hypothetical protein EOM41_06690 [Bacilli bacterium]|nr:hypothetical protein [Bacilli bacterium]